MDLLQKHFDTALESPDGIKKLRELILTLAMQGKLVKQDPNDQPASELLKEIQVEKERLTKEGKIKKQKEQLPIKPDEVPYQVPEGWIWVKLGWICSKITDGEHQTPPRIDQGFKLLSAKNVRDGYIDYENCDFISKEHYDNARKRCLPEKGDLLIVSVGGTIGRTSLIGEDTAFALVRSVAIIKPLIISSQFLRISFVSPIIQSIIHSAKRGGAQPCLYLSEIEQFVFPLPPLVEQKRIVAKIDELMALCDKLEAQRNACNNIRLAVHTSAINRLLTATDKNEFDTSWQFITHHFCPLYNVKENVAELKKVILTLAMHGKLVRRDPKDQPASELLKELQVEKERLIKEGKIKRQKELPPIKPEEVPYDVPERWVWTRLGEIGLVGSSGRVHQRDWTTEGVPFYRAREIIKLSKYGHVENELFITEKLFLELSKNGLVPEKDDIMLTGVGTIGIPYIVNNKDKFYFKDASVLILKNYFNIYPLFLDCLFKSPYWIYSIHLQSMGTTVHTLTISRAKETLIPLPSLAEQKRIVEKIDELMALCDNLENQIDQATAKQTALFDAVLAEA